MHFFDLINREINKSYTLFSLKILQILNQNTLKTENQIKINNCIFISHLFKSLSYNLCMPCTFHRTDAFLAHLNLLASECSL